MLLLMLSMAASEAKPLTSPEFDDTAHTLGPGKKQIDLFRMWQYAASQKVELKLSGIGLLGGPNLGVEYKFFQNKQGAFSANAHAGSGWLLGSQYLSGGATYTAGGMKGNRFNIAGGATVTSARGAEGTGRTTSLGTNVYGSFHLQSSPATVWRFWVSNDPYNSVKGKTFAGSGGVEWTHGWEYVRLALGVQAVATGSLANAWETLDIDTQDLPPIIPFPSFDVWVTW